MLNSRVLVIVALMVLSLGSTACGEQNRQLRTRQSGFYNNFNRPPSTPSNRANRVQNLDSVRHTVGQAVGEITATQQTAELLLQSPLASFAGVRFKGVVETYHQRPTAGFLSVAVYEQVQGAQPNLMNFNLVQGQINGTQAQLVFEGQYGQLVLNGNINRGTFQGQSSFAATGDELQSIGQFQVAECGFFTCK